MEYQMLAELSANAGRVLTYEHLLEKVWKEKSDADMSPMRTMVAKLRGKLGETPATPPTSSPSPGWATGCRRGMGRTLLREDRSPFCRILSVPGAPLQMSYECGARDGVLAGYSSHWHPLGQVLLHGGQRLFGQSRWPS